MADIFVSYSRKDVSFARALATALSAHGWSVWWDRHIPAGRTFDEVIAEALAAARCVIVVWSKDSVTSDWVREEADEGRRREILIPVLIDDVRPPLGFGRIQAADLRGWDGSEASDGFDKLVADIEALLGPVAPQHVSGPATSQVQSPVTVPPADLIMDKVTTTPSATTDGRRTLSRTDVRQATPQHVRATLRRRWKTLVASLGVAAIVVFGLYRFGAFDTGSQPRPIMGAAEKPALRLNAILEEGTEPITEGVGYSVFEWAQDAEGNRKPVTDSGSYQGPPRFELPPGRYFVTASYGSASASTEVEVRQATLTLQTLNLRAGVLRPSATLADGSTPLPNGVAYTVDDTVADIEGNRKRITSSGSHEGPPRFILPAGRYLVTAAHGSASRSIEVDVAAGENKALPVPLEAGMLNLSSQLTAGAPPLDGGVAYDVYEAAADGEGNRKRVTRSGSHEGRPRLPLPAGRYFVTAAHGSATASREIDVAAGEITRLVLDLRAGILSLQAIAQDRRDPLKQGVTYEIFHAAPDAEGNRRRIVSSGSYEGPPPFPLPAGQYYVTASAAQGKAEAEVTLGAGEHRQLQLQLQP
jgi:hypothetical protein